MESNSWHYIYRGQTKSDVSQDDIVALIYQGELNTDDLVWREGYSDWKAIKDSEIADLLKKSKTPPPLKISSINGTYIWLLVFVPVLALPMEILINEFSPERALTLTTLGYILLNSIFSALDEQSLKRGGHKHVSFFWAALLVPVYLWLRASRFRLRQKYLITWLFLIIFNGYVVEVIYSEHRNDVNLSTTLFSSQLLYNEKEAISSVKLGSFSSYPSKAIGSSLDEVVDKITWESFVADDNTVIVQVNGKFDDKDLLIQFSVYEENSFEISYFSLDSVPLNNFEIDQFLENTFSHLRDLRLKNYSIHKGFYSGMYVGGTLLNDGDFDVKSIFITFSLYDKNNRIIGETSDCLLYTSPSPRD